jgi:hypothetical protein
MTSKTSAARGLVSLHLPFGLGTMSCPTTHWLRASKCKHFTVSRIRQAGESLLPSAISWRFRTCHACNQNGSHQCVEGHIVGEYLGSQHARQRHSGECNLPSAISPPFRSLHAANQHGQHQRIEEHRLECTSRANASAIAIRRPGESVLPLPILHECMNCTHLEYVHSDKATATHAGAREKHAQNRLIPAAGIEKRIGTSRVSGKR